MNNHDEIPVGINMGQVDQYADINSKSELTCETLESRSNTLLKSKPDECKSIASVEDHGSVIIESVCQRHPKAVIRHSVKMKMILIVMNVEDN